jgi:DTW domain-containing protein
MFMNVEMYRKNRQEHQRRIDAQFPKTCQACNRPQVTCYCHLIRRIDLSFKFVILIHPLEARRRVATGRMTHLCLSNSLLLRGHDFSNRGTVNALLENPKYHSVVLYPGKASTNLTHLSLQERAAICPTGKELLIFVLDGTWATANKTLKDSQNLRHLPQICFTPDTPSNFRIRKQPRENCYSTIEAVHKTIDLMGPSLGFDTATRPHDNMLHVFTAMIEQQIEFRKISRANGGPSRYSK